MGIPNFGAQPSGQPSQPPAQPAQSQEPTRHGDSFVDEHNARTDERHEESAKQERNYQDPPSGDYGEPVDDPYEGDEEESEWEQMKSDVAFLLSQVRDTTNLSDEQRARIGAASDECNAKKEETDNGR